MRWNCYFCSLNLKKEEGRFFIIFINNLVANQSNITNAGQWFAYAGAGFAGGAAAGATFWATKSFATAGISYGAVTGGFNAVIEGKNIGNAMLSNAAAYGVVGYGLDQRFGMGLKFNISTYRRQRVNTAIMEQLAMYGGAPKNAATYADIGLTDGGRRNGLNQQDPPSLQSNYRPYSISASWGFAFLGGAGVEVGKVYAQDGNSWYFRFNQRRVRHAW